MLEMSLRRRLVLISLVCASVVGVCHAKIVSVNLNNPNEGKPGSMTPTDIAGAPDVRVGNWNNIDSENNTLGDNEAILFDDGAVVEEMLVTVETNYNWFHRENGSYENDEIMYNSVIDNYEGVSTVSLNDVPFAVYNVYFYIRDDQPDRAATFTHVGSGLSYYARGGVGNPDSDGNGYVLSTDTSFTLNDSSSVDQGNYVVFEDLSGDAVFEISATDTEAGALRNKWAGFQIVGEVDRTKARQPVPADQAVDVAPEPLLSWAPGEYAMGHNIYLSDDFNEVNDSSALLVEDLEVNSIDVGRLELGKTYYWRVDEVNGAPDYMVYPGTVWSFTVEPVAFAIDGNDISVTASSYAAGYGPEKTVDESGLNALDQHSMVKSDMWVTNASDTERWIHYAFDQSYTLHELWIWNSNQMYENILGYGIKAARIEVSLDGVDWTVLEPNVILTQAPGAANAGVSCMLDFNGVLASDVRITALSNWAGQQSFPCSLSEVRFTRIPTAARLPVPADGESDVPVDVTLSWRSGRYAVQHEVYLGIDANELSLIATTEESSYAPEGLVYGQAYAWRVDEVNEAREMSRYSGEVWSFSTPPYRQIDDMESYDEENWIYSIWVDGYDDQGDDNSSQVGHDDPPFVEQTIAYEGSQSMPLYFNNENSGMYASAIRTLDHEDWTQGGLQTLTLFFRGQWDNVGGELYVQINSSKVVCDTPLNMGLWTQWNIGLASLSMDLSDIESLTMGVDGVGEGRIYIDEIRLYHEAPAVMTASDPGASNLVLHYSLDGDVQDQSGYGLHGALEGSSAYRDSLSGLGQALEFDGFSTYVEMPVGDLVARLSESSYSVWVQIDEDADGNWMRIFDFGTGTTNYMFLTPRSGTSGSPEFGIVSPSSGSEQDVAAARVLSEGWHHLAVTIGSSDLSLYVDGTFAGSDVTNTLPQDLGVTTQNWLGQSQWSGDDLYEGLIDEFRIYDRSLTASEVRYLAGDQ